MAKRFFWFLVAVVALMVTVGLYGCRTQYVPKETVRIEYREADTTAIYNRLLKLFESKREKESRSDSLVDRTKETVVLNEKGDTTRHDKERIVYRATRHEKELKQKVSEQNSIIKDLRTQLSSVKVDSIQVPYPVERKLTAWEKAKIDSWWWMAVALAGVAGYMWRRPLKYVMRKVIGKE